MLPSRGPIQVTLEDTGSRIPCTKPPTQVKILSRPRVATATVNGPISSDSRDPTNTVASSSTSSTTPQVGSSQNGSVGNYISPPERISYSSVATGSMNIANRAQNHQQQQPLGTSSSLIADVSMGSKSNISSNNKKPMKTYQERADEYAKARLRILGSAFPEDDRDDGSLTNSENVNRILNLESVPSSSSSQSALNTNLPSSSGSGYSGSEPQNGKSYSSCFYNNNRQSSTSSTNAIGTRNGFENNSDNRGSYARSDNNVGFYTDNNRVHKS